MQYNLESHLEFSDYEKAMYFNFNELIIELGMA